MAMKWNLTDNSVSSLNEISTSNKTQTKPTTIQFCFDKQNVFYVRVCVCVLVMFFVRVRRYGLFHMKFENVEQALTVSTTHINTPVNTEGYPLCVRTVKIRLCKCMKERESERGRERALNGYIWRCRNERDFLCGMCTNTHINQSSGGFYSHCVRVRVY